MLRHKPKLMERRSISLLKSWPSRSLVGIISWLWLRTDVSSRKIALRVAPQKPILPSHVWCLSAQMFTLQGIF